MTVQTFFKAPRVKCDPQAERDLCHSLARHICQRCTIARSVVAHHVLLRKHGGSDLASNLAALCDSCHRAVHDAPGDAYIDGFLRRLRPKPGDYWYEGESE